MIAYPLLAAAGAILDTWSLFRKRNTRLASIALVSKVLPLAYIIWSFSRSDAPFELLFTMPFVLGLMVSVDLQLVGLLFRDYTREVTEIREDTASWPDS